MIKRPNPLDAVLRTGAQSVAGVKTFGSIPILPASNPTADNEAARKAFVDEKAADYVQLVGAQNVGGVKTFTSIPVLPASDPTAANEVTRKAYIDGQTHGRGAYSAIVYQDGDLCVAEDAVGTIINENTDDATVIQAAIDSLEDGTLFIAKGDYNIPSADINIDTSNHKVNIEGESFNGWPTTEKGTKLNFSNGHGIYFTGTGWYNQIRNLGIIGDGTGTAISNDSPAGNFNCVVFKDLIIRDFAKGIELNMTVSNHFEHILMEDATQGMRFMGTSWGLDLKSVSTYGTCTEGIYIHHAHWATLLHCDGGTSSTFGLRIEGAGITILSPYSEQGTKMELSGSAYVVMGGYWRGEVIIGAHAATYGVQLINMVSYENRNQISFTVNNTYSNANIVIDINVWGPTVTDAGHRAVIRKSGHTGSDLHYIVHSGAGHKFADLLAIPTSLPTYGLTAGTMYFIAATNTLYIYNGSAWKSTILT